jgi:3-oxoacyl-[acyl-carrier-protein] synthase-1
VSDTNRVYVTGYGAITACGASAEDTWQSIVNGQTGIAEVTQWDIASWDYRLGGEIKDFQPAKLLPDRKLIKVISRQDVMGINAAVQAVEHSGMIAYRDSLASPQEFNELTGVYVGSPGNKYFQQYDFLSLVAKSHGDMSLFAQDLFSEVHPMWLLRILPNNVLAYTGITYNLKGTNHNVTNHAVSSMQALLEAYHAIKQGYADRVVVVGYDMGVEPQALFYYEKLGLISPRHLRPFDREHDGTILAEGAAALVLESEASAKARNATCHAEIVGGASATEAVGLFSIEEAGKPLASLLKRTLQSVDIAPDGLDLIVAHGNGNTKSDVTEAMALEDLFEGHAMPPVTAFKWATGHTITASGILDTLLALLALQKRCVPGIASLEELASPCANLNATSHSRDLPAKGSALVINRGFAGMNACILVKGCE